MRLLACLVAAALLMPSAGQAAPDDDLRPLAIAIVQARAQIYSGNTSAGADLPSTVEALTRIIEQQPLERPFRSIAYYYRGQARYLQDVVREKRFERIDRTRARAALADFETVIDAGVDVREWGISVADTQYEAGVLSLNFLRDNARAYRFWQSCADREHAGCMSIMADARLAGRDGRPADTAQALAWHARVYHTGIGFKCAGAFSARALAEITYFTGQAYTGEDALAWLDRAYDLQDDLRARGAGPDPCGRSGFTLSEFLIRLGAGERRADLVGFILAGEPDRSVVRASARYLAGEIDDAAYDAVVEQLPVARQRCRPYLYALWFEALSDRQEKARAHWQKLVAIGDGCATELVYARKFGFHK